MGLAMSSTQDDKSKELAKKISAKVDIHKYEFSE